MKVHTTNYQNGFIQVAEDCPAISGQIPPTKKDLPSVAEIQFELVSKNPYKFTSDDVIFEVFARRNEISETELEQARAEFFSKGQPCFRTSPLTKRYGWGVHCDNDGKIALVGCDTPEYRRLSADPNLKVVRAMRSKRNT